MIIELFKLSLLSLAIAVVAIPLSFAAWIGLAIIGF
jgi:hypothetical protein